MIVTPGDILSRCQVLDARIALATKAIEGAPLASIDQAFRDAWNARSRRWHEVRAQCGDWASRWWNWKWEPMLDDWFKSQAEWEQQIEARSGRALPLPQPVKPDEQPSLPQVPGALVQTGKGVGIGIGLGFAAAVGIGLYVYSVRRR